MGYTGRKTKDSKINIKNLIIDTVPKEYEDRYFNYCHEKNVKRLPFFFLFTGLHHIILLLVYLALYPVLLDVATRDVNFLFLLYLSLYFIFLLLASYVINKTSKRLLVHVKTTNLIYFAAIVILFTGDFIIMHYFMGVFNLVRFLTGAMLIALLPVFSKKTANLLLLCQFLLTLTHKYVLGSSFEVYIVGVVYSASLMLVAVLCSSLYKSYHLRVYEESLKISEQNQSLRKLTVTDVLTKISNRRAFDEYMSKIWESSRGRGQSLTVMMMDVDHFKLYNDSFGHIEGDKCLVRISEQISTKFRRRGDMFARFGGEEFIAVIANKPGDNMVKFAEKVRMAVEKLEIPTSEHADGPFVTISIGVASRTPEEVEGPSNLVELADGALYAAKQTGRNRVVADFMEITSLPLKDKKPAEAAADRETTSAKEEFARLNTIVRANMYGNFSLDLKTGILEFGMDSARKLGISKGQTGYLRMSYADFVEHVHYEDRESLYRAFNTILAGMFKYEDYTAFRMKIKDSAYSWVCMRIAYTKDMEESELFTETYYKYPDSMALGSISDFSAFVRLQEVNTLIIEGTANYYCIYNYADDTIEFSEGFCKDFGLKTRHKENAFEWLISFLRDQEEKENLIKSLSMIKDGETDYCTFKANIFNNQVNSVSSMSFKGKCSRDEEGNPLILAGTINDISQEVRNEELNKLIIEGSSDCIFIFDLEKNMFEFSSKIYEMISIKTRKMKNGLETFLNYVIPLDRDAFTDALEMVLSGKTDVFKAECRLKGRDSLPFWVAFSGKCAKDENGSPIIIAGSLINLDAMRQFSTYLDEIRNVDKLSGLPNRIAFNQELAETITSMSIAEDGEQSYIIMVDIDDFGDINSLHGLTVGDKLLTEYGALLALVVPHDTKLYHFESNLFVIYRSATTKEDLDKLCSQIIMYSSNGLLVDEVFVKITVSIGVAEFSIKDTVDDVVVNAELALRKAKGQKNSVNIFTQEDRYSYLARLNLESQLRDSILNDFRGFQIFYQPLLSTSLNMFIGAEALLRWRNINGDIVSPAVVIPALQSIGMFPEVESWIFENAAKQCAKWIEMTGFEDLIVNVNMSPARASKGGLAEETLEVLEQNGLSPANMFLELTEESLVIESQSNKNFMKELHEKGIRMAIDDFGTGYSSLGYLRDLPVCELKIDRSFVKDIEHNESSREFVAAIITLSHIMNYLVCVEGVETAEQARILAGLNADLLQGYYFSPPIPADVFEEKILKEMEGLEKFKHRYSEIRSKDIPEEVLATVEEGI